MCVPVGDVAITYRGCVPATARVNVQQLAKGGDLACGLVYL